MENEYHLVLHTASKLFGESITNLEHSYFSPSSINI